MTQKIQPRIVTLDAETYYSKEYSLSKMSTVEYLLDPRFQLIGVAVAVDDGYPVWTPGPYAASQVLHELELDRPGTVVRAHNAMFDGGILEYALGIKPWKYLCTMMGARPVLVPFTKGARMNLASLAAFVTAGPKGGYVVKAMGKRYEDFTTEELSAYGDYCIRDTEICQLLGNIISLELPDDELDLVDLTIKKYLRPQVTLNQGILVDYLKMVQDHKDHLLQSVGVTPEALRSNPQFAELLEQYGVAPPMKTSPTTGEETYAFAKTDEGFKALLHHENSTIQALAAARVGWRTTLAESRAKKLITLSGLPVKFGVPLLYAGAHTLRYSGYGGINLQNLPGGSPLRDAIEAPEGHSIVVGDLSQIEARMSAALTWQEDLIRDFETGTDVYSKFAAQTVFGIGRHQVGKVERFIGKTGILSLQYGVGPEGFKKMLLASDRFLGPDMYARVKSLADLKFCKRVVYSYRSRYENIRQFWDTCESFIGILRSVSSVRWLRFGPLFIGPEFIGLPNGTCLRYVNIAHEGQDLTYGPEGARRKLYGAKMMENIVQALSRIVMTRAELFLARRRLPSVMSVHDELVYCVLTPRAAKFEQVLQKALTMPVHWMQNLPLACETGSGASYGAAKKGSNAYQPNRELATPVRGKDDTSFFDDVSGRWFYFDPEGVSHWLDDKETARAAFLLAWK